MRAKLQSLLNIMTPDKQELHMVHINYRICLIFASSVFITTLHDKTLLWMCIAQFAPFETH